MQMDMSVILHMVITRMFRIYIKYAHSGSFSCAAHVVGGEPDDIQVPARLPADGLRPRAHPALRPRGPSHAEHRYRTQTNHGPGRLCVGREVEMAHYSLLVTLSLEDLNVNKQSMGIFDD